MDFDALPSKWKQTFHSLFSVENNVIDENNSINIRSIMMQALARGRFHSGVTMSLIASELADSIPERVSLSIQIMQKIVAAYDQVISYGDRLEIVALLQNLARDQQEHLRQKALSTPPFQSASQDIRDTTLRNIDAKTNLEIERIAGEVNLMAARKPAKIPLDKTSLQIMALLREEFIATGRNSSDLANGYVGPTLLSVQEAIMADGSVSQVDFDLSLSAVEKNGLVKTGPMDLYENKPNTTLMFVGFVNKREYAFLTEEGYRAANKSETKAPVLKQGPTINITGSHFHNSPVGAGTTVTQKVAFDVTNENETVNYLFELLSHNNGNVDASDKQEIKTMVDAANAGDMKTAKPILQKLFGNASSAVKELATGVLTAIVNKQLGLD